MKQVEWRFDVVSSELISGEPGAVGSHYRQLVKQGRKGKLEPDGEGTRVDTEVAIAMHGLLKLFEPFSGGQLRKTASRYEAALAERLGGTAGK